jgi:hypothetical protein
VADMSLIREHLIKKVTELMARDYDRFLNSLYRIDVNESKVHEILYSKDKTRIPEKLADLIIERQLIRVKTQLLYKQGKTVNRYSSLNRTIHSLFLVVIILGF